MLLPALPVKPFPTLPLMEALLMENVSAKLDLLGLLINRNVSALTLSISRVVAVHPAKISQELSLQVLQPMEWNVFVTQKETSSGMQRHFLVYAYRQLTSSLLLKLVKAAKTLQVRLSMRQEMEKVVLVNPD